MKNSEAEALLDIVYGMHNYLLAQKPHIKEYQKIRKLHGEVIQSMMDYYQDGKFITLFNSAYAEQMSSGNTEGWDYGIIKCDFNLETKVGNQALVDVLVYKVTPTLSCITEDFINNKRYRKPEKIEFLQSMLDSKAGLFEITSVDRNEGYAYLKEVFCGDMYKITDIGLSGDPGYDRHYMYTRIITYRKLSFNTGLNIVFNKKDPFIKNFIKTQKKDYNPNVEMLRFAELYNHYASDPKSVKTVSR